MGLQEGQYGDHLGGKAYTKRIFHLQKHLTKIRIIFSTYCRVLTNWQGMVKYILKDQSIRWSLSVFDLMENQGGFKLCS